MIKRHSSSFDTKQWWWIQLWIWIEWMNPARRIVRKYLILRSWKGIKSGIFNQIPYLPRAPIDDSLDMRAAGRFVDHAFKLPKNWPSESMNKQSIITHIVELQSINNRNLPAGIRVQVMREISFCEECRSVPIVFWYRRLGDTSGTIMICQIERRRGSGHCAGR
jgi:hypothetical protein